MDRQRSALFTEVSLLTIAILMGLLIAAPLWRDWSALHAAAPARVHQSATLDLLTVFLAPHTTLSEALLLPVHTKMQSVRVTPDIRRLTQSTRALHNAWAPWGKLIEMM